MPKGTLGMTGLHEISGRENGIEEPYLGSSELSTMWDIFLPFLRRLFCLCMAKAVLKCCLF